MYHYQPLQHVHATQQQQQPTALAHLQLQHLEPGSRTSQASSSNSLAAALIPNTASPSSQQHTSHSSLQHDPELLHHQLQQHHGHTNELMSSQYWPNNAYIQPQQGTRIADELEMPPLDGWPGPGPSSGSGLGHNRHFQFQPQSSHVQSAVAYHNPKPTYPMHAQAQMMHDAVSDADSQHSYAHSLASSATSAPESLLFGYAQGETQLSASASDSSGGAGMDAAVGGAPHAVDERWPDPHGLLPLGMDVGNVLGEMGMGMGYGGNEMQFAMNVGGGMEGWDGMGGMGNVDLGVAYDMGLMGVGPSGYGVGPGFGMDVGQAHGHGGLASQAQMPMGMTMAYGAGMMDRPGLATGTGGQDGWVPIHSEDPSQHQLMLPRPLSASSSVGSGSNSASASGSTSSLAHANTYIPSPPPGQAQGPEQRQDVNNISTYHSHGVQIASPQQQQQQQYAALQGAYNANPELVQAPEQQQAVSYPPLQHEQTNQASQAQSRPSLPPPPPRPHSQESPSAQPPLPAAPPKLLPGQTGMLPPPDIPVRRKVGRPRGAKTAKSSRTYPGSITSGNTRGSGSSERPVESTQPTVPSSVEANKTGYVYPQVSQPRTFGQQTPRSQSLPDLHLPHVDSHGEAEGQGYSRTPLAHRYSDEDMQRAREQSERDRQQPQQGVNQPGKSTTTAGAQVRSTTDVSSSSSATLPEQGLDEPDIPEASSADKAPEADVNSKPKAPYAHATMTMADGQWAIAQECNRAALTETFRLRHGRDPPPLMNILKTNALERSIPVEKALMKDVDREMREVEERNRKAREEAEAARRSWCGENADNLTDSQELVDSPSVDPDFWTKPLGPEWTPAQPAVNWGQASTAGIGQQQLVSPLSPNTPDEAITPLDTLFTRNFERASSSVPVPVTDTSSSADEPPAPSLSSSSAANASSTEVQTLPTEDGPLASRLRSIIRHDGHLPHHVSGLGGAYSEAYDGRSYLPDDAEPDPNIVPHIKNPRARMGDHPLLKGIRPHPLQVRGERWHALVNPNPDERFKTAVIKEEPENEDSTANETTENHGDELSMIVDHPASGVETLSDRQTLTKKDLESLEEPSQQGDGYGFPEGGSLGPGLGLRLPGLGDDAEGAAGRRLKLSTEKKAPPKMACHFCRNRKIACGVGAGEDKTCNQCLRRGLRCIYPTESRRGMRVRKPRSAHTVDGVDEADKDGIDDDDEYDPIASPTAGPTAKGKKPKKPKRGRGRPPRQPRAQDDDAEEEERNREGAMDVEDRNGGDMHVDQDYQEPNDPLASLAAEDRRQELQWVHQHPDMNNMSMGQEIGYSDNSGSAPSPTTRTNPPASVTTPTSSGPFTTSPLHRRPGRPTKRSVPA